jgi:hypothetical protein
MRRSGLVDVFLQHLCRKLASPFPRDLGRLVVPPSGFQLPFQLLRAVVFGVLGLLGLFGLLALAGIALTGLMAAQVDAIGQLDQPASPAVPRRLRPQSSMRVVAPLLSLPKKKPPCGGVLTMTPVWDVDS